MTRRIIISLIVFSGIFCCLHSQNIPEAGFYIFPVDKPYSMSGVFGELRDDHLHSGVDFSGKGKQGQNVYAVGDGYVSRIFVSSKGYGKAVYITHPEGFVSVYGHLKEFNSYISGIVKNIQYSRHTFYVNEFFDPGDIPVKKGDIIGYLGNSGGSNGPHLHFEFREKSTEAIINPALFGIKVYDTKAPVIQALKIVPMDNKTLINGKNNEVTYKVRTKEGKSVIYPRSVPEISGRVIFGIQANDLNNTNRTRTGVYKVSLFVDSLLFYNHSIDKFSFDDSRCINSLIDYKSYKTGKGRFMLTRVSPGNKLKIYNNIKNQGIVIIDEDRKYNMKYVVEDLNGNSTVLSFIVSGKKAVSYSVPTDTCENYFDVNEMSYFKNDFVEVKLPANALYDPVCFKYKRMQAPAWAYSSLHFIHDYYTPVNAGFELSILPESLPEKLKEKAVIAYVNSSGKIKAAGGQFEGNRIKTTVNNFGRYAVTVDTIPPEISQINICSEKDISGQESIVLKIKDNFSGIKSYNAYINGNWILMEYDEKIHTLSYHFDETLLPGLSTFMLIVTDKCNNVSEYFSSLMY